MIIVPAYNNRVVTIGIGGETTLPKMEDMEAIRDYYNKNNKVSAKELKWLFGYRIKKKIWPKIKSKNKYVWMLNLEDEKDYYISSWVKVFEEGKDDDNFNLFYWGKIDLKRINEDIIPFM